MKMTPERANTLLANGLSRLHRAVRQHNADEVALLVAAEAELFRATSLMPRSLVHRQGLGQGQPLVYELPGLAHPSAVTLAFYRQQVSQGLSVLQALAQSPQWDQATADDKLAAWQAVVANPDRSPTLVPWLLEQGWTLASTRADRPYSHFEARFTEAHIYWALTADERMQVRAHHPVEAWDCFEQELALGPSPWHNLDSLQAHVREGGRLSPAAASDLLARSLSGHYGRLVTESWMAELEQRGAQWRLPINADGESAWTRLLQMLSFHPLGGRPYDAVGLFERQHTPGEPINKAGDPTLFAFFLKHSLSRRSRGPTLPLVYLHDLGAGADLCGPDATGVRLLLTQLPLLDPPDERPMRSLSRQHDEPTVLEHFLRQSQSWWKVLDEVGPWANIAYEAGAPCDAFELWWRRFTALLAERPEAHLPLNDQEQRLLRPLLQRWIEKPDTHVARHLSLDELSQAPLPAPLMGQMLALLPTTHAPEALAEAWQQRWQQLWTAYQADWVSHPKSQHSLRNLSLQEAMRQELDQWLALPGIVDALDRPIIEEHSLLALVLPPCCRDAQNQMFRGLEWSKSLVHAGASLAACDGAMGEPMRAYLGRQTATVAEQLLALEAQAVVTRAIETTLTVAPPERRRPRL